METLRETQAKLPTRSFEVWLIARTGNTVLKYGITRQTQKQTINPSRLPGKGEGPEGKNAGVGETLYEIPERVRNFVHPPPLHEEIFVYP